MTLTRSLLAAAIGGLLGGLAVWLAQGHTLRVWPGQIAYQDLIAILLTAVSLVVAILGVVMAAFALWGYSQFKRVVEKRTREAVETITPGFLAEELRDGASRQVLVDLVAEFFRTEGAKPGVAEQWAQQREADLADLKEVDNDIE